MSPNLPLLSLSVATAFGPSPPKPGYLPNCASDNDYGWPRFNSATELKANAGWASYYQAVYAELPTVYPVCVYDFWVLNKTAFDTAGLQAPKYVANASDPNMKDGDMFTLNSMGMDFGIYHSVWTPVPNNTYVEVAHAVFPTELEGAWTWNVRGNGVFVNVGQTLVFPTPSDITKTHAAAIAFITKGCSVKISQEWPQMESDIFGKCAKEKGYDSVQFEPQQGQIPVGTFGITGLTEMVIVNLDGDKGCGVADPTETPLRTGWNASRQCKCQNQPIADNCGLMAKPPPPIFREEPPLCEIRSKNLFASCVQATCHTWKCEL